MWLRRHRVMFIRENFPRYRIELSGVLLDVCTLPHWTQRSRPVSKPSTSYREKNAWRRNVMRTIWGTPFTLLLINDGAWSSPLSLLVFRSIAGRRMRG